MGSAEAVEQEWASSSSSSLYKFCNLEGTSTQKYFSSVHGKVITTYGILINTSEVLIIGLAIAP